MRQSNPAPLRRAFTLVELLVVIGIIALLISILMPALSKAREQANAVKCMSNQRNLGNALIMFTNEHKGYLPKAWFNDGPSPGRQTWRWRDPMWGWDYILSQYMSGEKEVFRCPSDEPVRMRGLWTTGSGLPDRAEADDIAASYRINISNQHAPGLDLASGRPLYATKITKLKDSSKAIVFFDGANNPALWHHASTWEIDQRGLVSRNPWPQGYRANVGWDKHRERGMYVFADGHAESLTWEQTWQFVVTDDGMWHQFAN